MIYDKMQAMERKIIAIIGPTASGKTGIGVRLAKELNGEIVSADSRQVFRGLNLGTGKDGEPCGARQLPITNKSQRLPFGAITSKLPINNITIEQLRPHLRYIDNIPQWIIDVANPEEEFNLFKYLELARAAIEDIFSRGKTPIIVGGTGLYVQALIEGFQLKQIQNSKFKIQNYGAPTSRGGLSREQLSNFTIEQLNDILEKIDAEAFAKVDRKNPHRLIRAIERAQEGVTMTKVRPNFEVLQIGIDWPRDVLHERIDKRVDERFADGMLEEIAGLLNRGVDPKWLIGLGLEYRVITEYLLNCHFDSVQPAEKSYAEDLSAIARDDKKFELMKQVLKLRIRQFAKRQMTWFRRFPEIVWENDCDKIIKMAKKFLR
jgi:tRNA dimethylallyltransferase